MSIISLLLKLFCSLMLYEAHSVFCNHEDLIDLFRANDFRMIVGCRVDIDFWSFREFVQIFLEAKIYSMHFFLKDSWKYLKIQGHTMNCNSHLKPVSTHEQINQIQNFLSDWIQFLGFFYNKTINNPEFTIHEDIPNGRQLLRSRHLTHRV